MTFVFTNCCGGVTFVGAIEVGNTLVGANGDGPIPAGDTPAGPYGDGPIPAGDTAVGPYGTLGANPAPITLPICGLGHPEWRLNI